MKVKVYKCSNCGYEFRYNRKIISCAICMTANTIEEKNIIMNRKKAIEILEEVKLHYDSNGYNSMSMKIQDIIKYLSINK